MRALLAMVISVVSGYAADDEHNAHPPSGVVSGDSRMRGCGGSGSRVCRGCFSGDRRLKVQWRCFRLGLSVSNFGLILSTLWGDE